MAGNQEDVKTKANRLFENVKNLSEMITGAIEESRSRSSMNLKCVTGSKLDFNYLEEDIKRIHKEISDSGRKVLKSHLFLDNKRNLMEIRTYIEKGSETFLETARASVSQVDNIPEELQNELKKEGAVEIQIRI